VPVHFTGGFKKQIIFMDLQLVQKFSGVIAMIIVWLVLVLYPYLHKDLGYLNETISKLTTKKSHVLKVVTGALLVGSFFQMYFLAYIISRFNISISSLGSLLYLSMGVATICATIFNAKNYPKLHFWSAVYYFIVTPVMILVLGYEFISFGIQVFYASIIFSLLYSFVNLYIYLRHKRTSALFEIWGFLLLSIWTLYITFI
jgi:predicted MFS family arabinose efflux permease